MVVLLSDYTFVGVVRAVNRTGTQKEFALYLNEKVSNLHIVYGGVKPDGSGPIEYTVCLEKPGTMFDVPYNASVKAEYESGDNLFYFFDPYAPAVCGESLNNATMKETKLRFADEPSDKSDLVYVEICTSLGRFKVVSGAKMKRAEAEALNKLDISTLCRLIKNLYYADDPETPGSVSISIKDMPDPCRANRLKFISYGV